MLRHPLVTRHVVRFVQTPPRRPLQPPQPPALAARSRRPVSATGSQTAPRGARTGRAGPGDVPLTATLTATRPDPPRAISSQSRKAGLAAIAEGQVQTGTTLPPLLIPLEPPETFPPSGTQGGYLFNLRPLGSDFGQTLASTAFTSSPGISDEIATVSGGVKRGLSFQRFTQLGFDLDMERIAGITGGALKNVLHY